MSDPIVHASFCVERTMTAPPSRVFGAFADADVTLFDTPEAHHLFDEFVRILERGLASPAAPG